MPRIIGGAARRLGLKVPPGDRVRPTADNVREAIFNLLVHRCDRDLDGARVLDLFAGAGTLGLESLSRGAAYVHFVERDRRVAGVLRANAEAVGARCDGAWRIFIAPVVRALARGPSDAPFDLVCLDPPYRIGAIPPTLAAVADRGWLAPGGLIVAEHPADLVIEAPQMLAINVVRRYGDTAVTLLTAV